MKCRWCKQPIEFTHGKAYTGWVHAKSGQHVCVASGNWALIEPAGPSKWSWESICDYIKTFFSRRTHEQNG